MKNPWLKKNPMLSIWLSGANAVGGTVRAQATAEARRQMAGSMKQVANLWGASLFTAPPRKKRARRKP